MLKFKNYELFSWQINPIFCFHREEKRHIFLFCSKFVLPAADSFIELKNSRKRGRYTNCNVLIENQKIKCNVKKSFDFSLQRFLSWSYFEKKIETTAKLFKLSLKKVFKS